jgi:hypothetical protein
MLFDTNTKMPTSTIALLNEMIDKIVVETISRGKNKKIQYCSDFGVCIFVPKLSTSMPTFFRKMP